MDAIWTLALALHATETGNELINTILNSFTYKSLEVCCFMHVHVCSVSASNISLDKFNYESKEMAKRIFNHAMSVKFTGITVSLLIDNSPLAKTDTFSPSLSSFCCLGSSVLQDNRRQSWICEVFPISR